MTTAMPDSASPKPSASPGNILPAGIGRFDVRFMITSISASHHMFSAPEAPAPSAMNRIETIATNG